MHSLANIYIYIQKLAMQGIDNVHINCVLDSIIQMALL